MSKNYIAQRLEAFRYYLIFVMPLVAIFYLIFMAGIPLAFGHEALEDFFESYRMVFLCYLFTTVILGQLFGVYGSAMIASRFYSEEELLKKLQLLGLSKDSRGARKLISRLYHGDRQG